MVTPPDDDILNSARKSSFQIFGGAVVPCASQSSLHPKRAPPPTLKGIHAQLHAEYTYSPCFV